VSRQSLVDDSQDEAVREQVRAWLRDHWHPDGDGRRFREELADSGWAAPSWPVEWYGRGFPRRVGRVVAEEFRAVGAPGYGADTSNLYGNTLLVHGTDEQRLRHIRPLLTGELRGCLLYSEPGAGSDLAAVQTSARHVAGGWSINGQKVWTSSAHVADFGFLLARTDWDVPKHHGLTFFLLNMRQQGVEVRPLRQVTGGSHFNEVFLTDARATDADVVGNVNDGWRVLRTALAYEREVMGDSEAYKYVVENSHADAPWTRVIGGTDYVALAIERGAADDPVMRQQVAFIYTYERVAEWTAQRARAESPDGDSPLAALGKLGMSRLVHSAARLSAAILGAESMLDGPSWSLAAEVNRSAFAAYVSSIGGGTDQIQRNVIGEQLLRLPKEPEVDRDVPFRDVRKSGIAWDLP
jgi:alkylation response protein AidB-like acyl-CoA dehydrogenase